MRYRKIVNDLIQDKEVVLNSLVESFNTEYKKLIKFNYKYYSSIFMNKEGTIMYDGYLADNLKEVISFQAEILKDILERVEECKKESDNESNISN